MKNFSNISKFALVAATATMLAGGASFAMGNQFTEMDKTIKLDFAELGIPTPDFNTLTYAQLSEINGILTTKEKGADKQKVEIEQILNASHEDAMAMKTVKQFPAGHELAAIVVNDLKAIGVEVKNPEKLTLEQLGRLSDILNGGKDHDGMKEEAEMVLMS